MTDPATARGRSVLQAFSGVQREVMPEPLLAFLLILATQILDAFGLLLALGKGHEANPIMAVVLGAGGIGALLAVKLAAGALVALVVARVRPGLAPWFGLVGCAGCLSALVVVMA